MKVRVLYFARLRESFGLSREHLELADGSQLEDLLAHLRARGGPWARELAPERAFRLAVNQDIAPLDTRLQADDEIALFPPVTGG